MKKYSPIVFITLGTSDLEPTKALVQADILAEGSFKEHRHGNNRFIFSSMRQTTQALLAHPACLEDVLYPITKPGITYILKHVDKIKRLIFVVTDQIENPHVEPYQLRGDTIFAADVMEALIKRDFEGRVESFEKLRVTDNPADYSYMYKYFGEILSQPAYQFDAHQRVYLMAQGGIDGTNLSLTLNCIEKYPHLTQIAKPDDQPRAIRVDTPQHFRQNFSKQRILRDLDGYQYLAIVQEAYSQPMEKLAEFAFSCLSFDFERAEDCTEALHEIDQDRRDFYRKLDRYLDALRRVDMRLREMYISAKIRFLEGNYADFLIKISAMAETMLKQEIEHTMAIRLTFYFKQPKWKAAIQQFEGLQAFLGLKEDDYFPMGYKQQARILGWFVKEKAFESSYLSFHDRFSKLKSLRNKVAHSPHGMNAELIYHALSEEEGESHFQQLVQELDEHFQLTGMGIYDTINTYLKNML